VTGGIATIEASPAVEAAAPSVAPSLATTAQSSTAPTSTDAIVMGPPSGASAAGWTEIGRTPVNRPDGASLSSLRKLTAFGDQLVAIGTIDETAEGPSHDVILVSTDGLTWTPIVLPGTDPILTDLAATSGGLLAGGSVDDGGERRGNLWTSTDGTTWQSEPGPPFAEVDRFVSLRPLVLTDNGRDPRVWVNRGPGEWATTRRVNEFEIAHGPGGYLMWHGGGQDEMSPTRIMHSKDASEFTDVELPAPLTRGRDAQAGVTLFPLADRWVLVPSAVKLPKTIYTSKDGRSWQKARRPARMTEDVRWVADVGDTTQAFGLAKPVEAHPSDLVPTPTAIWTWKQGVKVPEPAIVDPEGDDFIDAPVAFGDGYVAVGRDGGEDSQVTVWRYVPPVAG
jgi:hypothetical protein